MKAALLIVALVILVAVGALLLLWHPGSKGPDGGGVAGLADGNGTVSSTQGAVGGAFGPWHGKQAQPVYDAAQPSCVLCHWNPDLSFWKANWTATGDGKAWNLTVTPRYPEVALVTVQATTGAGSLVQATEEPALATWNRGDTWTGSFTVGPAASAVVAEFRVQPSNPGAGAATAQAQNATGLSATTTDPQDPTFHFAFTLTLRSPSGQAMTIAGPEPDQKIAVVLAPEAGEWTFEARLDDATYAGQALPSASGLARIDVLQGSTAGPVVPAPFTVTGKLPGPSSATFTFPATSDGAPPNVHLRFRLYQDHDQFYQQEQFDSSTADVDLRAVSGPEPGPPHYSPADIVALWGDQSFYTLHEIASTKQALYATDADGAISTYVAGEPYSENLPSSKGLLPGARSLRFEVAWTPPIDIPDLEVRFSPGSDPHWFQAEQAQHAPGSASFIASVDPAWWDAPGIQAGDWDMNLLRPLAPSQQYAYAIQYTMRMVAER